MNSHYKTILTRTFRLAIHTVYGLLITTNGGCCTRIFVSISKLKSCMISTPDAIHVDEDRVLQDARITIYEDEREMILTYVSTYDIQGQSIKANYVQMKQSNGRGIILNTRITQQTRTFQCHLASPIRYRILGCINNTGEPTVMDPMLAITHLGKDWSIEI